MERELWRRLVAALKRLPRWWPRRGVYSNGEVLAVLLWAALHDRSILWATRRSSWPVQAWRRRLPDQSTMSRRLRDERLAHDLRRLLPLVQRGLGDPVGPLVLDGKPLTLSVFTTDRDARLGWGAGRHAIGYKLHVLVDRVQRLLDWEVRPMNEAECVVAAELLRRTGASRDLRGLVALADASYDSNPLHAQAAAVGVRLIAPRRRPELGLCGHRKHHPNRLAAIHFTEHDPAWRAMRVRDRTAVERYFGCLATVGGGLSTLPTWVRRTHRVNVWVGAKVVINAARDALRKGVAA